MFKLSTKRLCRAGIIAALYVALTFIVLPVAAGAIQFRPSEALTLLPLFFPEAIPALFVGCLLANWIAGCAIADILLGATVSLVAASLTYLAGRLIRHKAARYVVGGLFPVLLNAFFLPLIWVLAYGQQQYIYIVNVAFLLLSQSVVIYALGIPLCIAIKKYYIDRQGVSRKQSNPDEQKPCAENREETDSSDDGNANT